MLRSISWRQFIEWQAFAELEPFDEKRQDWRNAHLVATIVSMNKGKRGKAMKLEDALLQFGDSKKDKRTQSWKQQQMIAKMLFAAHSQDPTPATKKRRRR